MKTLIKFMLFIGIIFTINTLQADDKLPNGLSVTIAMDKTQLKSTDSLIIHTTFYNTTQDTIKFLKWNTPLEGRFHANFFTIRNAQQEAIRYTGKLLKRSVPQTDDFIVLAAGKSISQTLNLSAAYDLKVAGDYSVTYRLNKQDTHNNINFTLLEDRIRHVAQRKLASYNSCSASQKDILNKVIPEASKMANTSMALLTETSEDNRPSATRYTTWFGDYDYARYDTVLSNFKTLQSTLENKEILFKCDCNEAAIAYVFAEKPYEIHICPTFWSLDLNGTDSQAGTVIHELSHFKIIASTDDYVYGKNGAESLADKFPEDAIKNADNYEYFAENNNPYLSMYAHQNKDSHEPDNSKEKAKYITFNKPQVYTIHSVGDEDWSKFELFFESHVNIHLTGPAGGDTELTLYDNKGNKLAFNNNINPSFDNNYSEISKDNLKKGTYYLKVNGYKNNTLVQEYQLTLSVLTESSNKDSDSSDSGSGTLYWPTLLILLLSGFMRKKRSIFHKLKQV